MTRLGWLRRQASIAKDALRQYPIDVDRAVLVSADTNFIYRVRCHDGARYALRLVAPEWRTEQNLLAEVAWLSALACDTEISVPKVIETRSGEPFARVIEADSGNERRALLMSWLPGRLLARRLSATNVARLGTLFADLHEHASNWTIPLDFPRVAFTTFLGRGEPDALFAALERGELPREVAELLIATRHRVEGAYASFSSDDRLVIHCDLWHENVKLLRGRLAPIDFEDTILGYREHDLAMALLDLAEEVPAARYPALVEHLIGGYEQVATFPDGDILACQLGRVLWQLNWTARFHPTYLSRAVRAKQGLLERALTSGTLGFDA